MLALCNARALSLRFAFEILMCHRRPHDDSRGRAEGRPPGELGEPINDRKDTLS